MQRRRRQGSLIRRRSLFPEGEAFPSIIAHPAEADACLNTTPKLSVMTLDKACAGKQ
jgi:hypothetical protein